MQSRLALALLLGVACSAPAAPPNYAVREDRDQASTRLAVEIATHGLEPQRCGFHLIRPDDDPYWSGEYGPFDPTLPSGGFRWDSWEVRYLDVQYQHRNIFPAEELPPGFLDNTGWCLISNERALGNEVLRACAVAMTDGTFSVSATIDQRALEALTARLADQEKFRDGTVRDWFGVSRNPAARRTRMLVALVSNSIVYLPVDVSALVAARAPTTVTLARGLSRSDAEQLAHWLALP